MDTTTARRTPAQTTQQRPAKRRRRHFSRRVRFLALVFMVLLVACATVFVVRLFVSKPNEETLSTTVESGVFIPGVTVGGIDVAGLRLDEARALLISQVEQDVKGINVRVVHNNTVWVLSAADMGAVSNLDIVLNEAIQLGHSGTFVENKKVQEDTLENGHAYVVGFMPDEATLAAKLAVIGQAMDTAPVEPGGDPITTGITPGFTYHEGMDGYMLDEAALAADITQALASGDYAAVLEPALELTAPTHDIAWVQENTVLRTTYQTSFGGSRSAREANRVGNIQKATTLLNGAKIEDGAQFDFNEFIGPRTEAGGWPLAPGIVSGNSYELQAGGGICQVSTTLYIALLCAEGDWNQDFALAEEGTTDLSAEAPIIVNERHHHSWPSSYADRGTDATVTTGGKNLRFINNTGAPLYIFAYCDQENYLMTIHLYGKPLETGVTYKIRGETIETIEPEAAIIEENPNWPIGYSEDDITSRKGYKAEVFRDKYLNDVLVEDATVKLYSDSYRAVQGKRIIGTGAASLPIPTAE